MKETHVFKGVKLTEKQVRFVQSMASAGAARSTSNPQQVAKP